MNKAKRIEIGNKVRTHVVNNFEAYFLATFGGGLALASLVLGGHEARKSLRQGFRYGHKAGWSEGYMKSIDWVVEHVMEDGQPISYIKDGQDYLIDVALKKTS
jgi:hypothetical protein